MVCATDTDLVVAASPGIAWVEESESFETLEQWLQDFIRGQGARIRPLTAHIEHRVPYDVEYRLAQQIKATIAGFAGVDGNVG